MGGTLSRETDSQRYRVDRGPNWLFVKLSNQPLDNASLDLSDEMWAVCVKHLTYRLVVELDGVEKLPASTTDQLDSLRERLIAVGGALRLCGANEDCQQTLSGGHYAVTLKSHADRASAVNG